MESKMLPIDQINKDRAELKIEIEIVRGILMAFKLIGHQDRVLEKKLMDLCIKLGELK